MMWGRSGSGPKLRSPHADGPAGFIHVWCRRPRLRGVAAPTSADRCRRKRHSSHTALIRGQAKLRKSFHPTSPQVLMGRTENVSEEQRLPSTKTRLLSRMQKALPLTGFVHVPLGFDHDDAHNHLRKQIRSNPSMEALSTKDESVL